MKEFSIVVAFDDQQGIGKGGVMPWHLPDDLRHFKEVTTARPGRPDNVVIMGRKTWESIPGKFRPLPGRINVVITGQSGYLLPEGVVRAGSLKQALDLFCAEGRSPAGDVFIIGGAQVFAEAIGFSSCRKIYLTRIYGSFGCDVLFPQIPDRFVSSDDAKEGRRSKENKEFEKIFSFHILTA